MPLPWRASIRPSAHAGETSGRFTAKVAPPFALAAARIEPPWDNRIERLMDRPRPMPWDLVVTMARADGRYTGKDGFYGLQHKLQCQ